MKRTITPSSPHLITCFFAALLLIPATSLLAQQSSQPNTRTDLTQPASIRAFPSAEGFGAYARGGRAGKTLHVTNLNDSGPGSLRHAVNATGPRTIVFDVAGTIPLQSELNIANPYITIAGQTAPGEGITIRNHPLQIETSHVIIRYIRSRLGDSSPSDGDAISISRGRHIILDHCSASWSLDEALSASTGQPHLNHVTVQWCFISEALNPENHSFGSLIRGSHGAQFSFHHNLYAHNRNRNPRPGNYNRNPHNEDPQGLLLDFRNNVIYNWRGNYAGYSADEVSVTRLNYVANFLIPGPDSNPDSHAYRVGSTYNRSYFAGNYMNFNKPASPWTLVDFKDWPQSTIDDYKQPEPFSTGPITTDSPHLAYQQVLAYAGASFPARDPVDARVARSIRHRTGSIINSPSQVGGYPDLAQSPPPPDSDRDGLPDAWERKHNLNPDDPTDANTPTSSGYTHLEIYLNSLPTP